MKKSYFVLSFSLSILLSLFILINSGCATPYKPHGFMGGYRDTQIQPNIFQVYVRGNGYTSPDRVFKIALVRSAELALQNNCDYFYILDISESEKTYYNGSINPSSYLTSVMIVPITKPRITMLIKTVKEPEEEQEEPFDAQFILNNVLTEL